MNMQRIIGMFTIIIYLFITLGLLYAIHRYGDYKSPAFWIAALLEIGFAFLTVNVKLMYLKILLIFFGGGLPTILSGNFELMKPIGASVWIYLLVGLWFGSFRFYRTHSKKPVSLRNILDFLATKW